MTGRAATIREAARRRWRRLGAPGRSLAFIALVLAAVYAVGSATLPGVDNAQGSAARGGTAQPPAQTQPAAAPPSPTSPGAPGGNPPSTAWIESLAKLVGAMGISWALVVLVFLIVFRASIGALLDALRTALADRAVTFDVASVKIQVAEPGSDPWDERSPGFSRSLLEIEEAPLRERSSILDEIAPQLLVPLSSYVARRWATGTGAPSARAMQGAHDGLRAACETARTFQEIRPHLVTFARRFEEARFFQADRFRELLARYPVLADGVRGLRPRDLAQDADDLLILHAAGVAHAQAQAWKTGIEILGAIVWHEHRPLYLAAADTWLACAYHLHLEQTRTQTAGLDIESPEFFGAVDDLLRRAGQVVEAMRQAPMTVRSGYYQRELLKVVGSIASILGEHSRTSTMKAAYFEQARQALAECTQTIDGDPPSPLDYNNLADLYRQIGDHRRRMDDADGSASYYARAHRELDVGCPPTDPPDPAFVNTRALIFAGQAQPLKGLLALQRYGEAEATGADGPDLTQYVENQILAARLAAALESDSLVPCLGLTATILEAVRGFVERHRDRLGRATADGLQAQIEELRGYVYLQMPGQESRAVQAYGGLSALVDDTAGADVRWRRQLGRAKASSRLAGSERRAFAAQVARQYWKDAFGVLASSATAVKGFGVDAAAASAPRRVRHLRLRVDTIVALQAVAEEGVRAGERLDARALVEQETEILTSVHAALADDALRQALGTTLSDVQSQVRECAARRSYVLGRILIRDDPGFNDASLVDKVENTFAAARGAGEDLGARIDLELGEFLLAAAATGKGDVRARYEHAVASLERAAARHAPALRGETIRALAEAYARRPAFLKKAKDSKPAN